MKTQDTFQEMIDRWPSAVVARRQIKEFTGGIISPKYLANQDSLGTGPSKRIEICGRIGYPVDALVEWLKSRSQTKR